MIVKIGIVEKSIPQEYACGTDLITIDLLESAKKRLTPMERFLFAEAAWRVQLDDLTKAYIVGSPTGVIRQYNRAQESRHCVTYGDPSGINCLAIVPAPVWRACPAEILTEDNVEFNL